MIHYLGLKISKIEKECDLFSFEMPLVAKIQNSLKAFLFLSTWFVTNTVR